MFLNLFLIFVIFLWYFVKYKRKVQDQTPSDTVLFERKELQGISELCSKFNGLIHTSI